MTDDNRPRFSLALPEGSGLARFASTYLCSAFLVLLGGWLTLYGDGGKPRHYELAHVLGTQLLYAGALVGVLFVLAKRRSCRRDVALLLPLLLVFLLDGLLVQHLYGWVEPEGIAAALIGGGVSVALMLATARRLRFPWLSPLVAMPVLAVLFARLGPFLLSSQSEVQPLVPQQVALGWLLGLCLLPCIAMRSAAREPSELPLRRLELGSISLSLGFALLHFLPSGSSFDLPFRFAYLAPFVILAGPAIDELFPAASRRGALRILSSLLPALGALLAATQLTPGFAYTDWTQSWPLTPFWLALILAAFVELGRALGQRDRRRLHVAAGLGVLALLGGDLPEVLATTFYPETWQVLAAAFTTLPVLIATRRHEEGLILHALPAWLAASWLTGLGYPRLVAWIVLLTWGAVLLDLLRPREGRRSVRLATALVLTAVPVGHAITSDWSLASVSVAVVSCALAALAGLATQDPLLRVAGPGCAVAGLLALPLRLQIDAGLPPGILVVEAGFALLLVGLVSSVAGDRLADLAADWWRSVEAARSEPG